MDDRLAVETARLSVDHRIEDSGRTIDLTGEAVASRVDGQLDLIEPPARDDAQPNPR